MVDDAGADTEVEEDNEAQEDEQGSAGLIHWTYEGQQEHLNGPQSASVNAEVIDDVFGKAELLDVRNGKLLLHLSDGQQKFRTAGHVYIKTSTEQEQVAVLDAVAVQGANVVDDGPKEEEGGQEEETHHPAKKLVLYSATHTYNGKRPIMHVLDAEVDPDELSSRKIKKCRWVKNVPSSIKNVDFSPNKAVTCLRDAIKPSDKVMGSSGVNKNVALMMTAQGPKLLLKAVIEAKKLRTYLKD